jgi:plastocyanin
MVWMVFHRIGLGEFVMKKSILSFVIAGLVLVAFTGCSSGSKNMSSISSTVTSDSTSSISSTSASSQSGNMVTIVNFQFNPGTLTIKAGDTVEWKNNDSATHTIVFDNFKSGSVNQGDSYKHTFDTAGTFNYSCGIHPSMKETIVVK